MTGFRLYILGIPLGLLALVGCSVTPSLEDPEAEQELPGRFKAAPGDTTLPAAAADTAAYDATRWWTAYEDPALTALVDTALAANLELASARARVEELAARFRIARAPLFPSVSADGQVSYQNQPANTGISSAIGGDRGPDRFEFTDYQASLGLSYEIDFWGRVRSQRAAALSQYFATAADLQTARLSVVSQTIATYAQIASLQRQVRLGRRTVDLLEQRLAVTEDRYDRGLVPSFQVYTVRQSLQSARAEQPDLENRLYDAQGRLAVLLGRFAGAERTLLPDSMAIPLAPEPIPAGLPSDLLMQRPDVRAAALRLEAARQEIGVARAEMLPSLSLTGQGGTQSSELADLVDPGQAFATFVGQLTAPLFQGGRLRANLSAAEARYKQQAAAYEQTVLTAFQEVKAALVAYDKQRRRYREVRRQVETAQDAFQTQRGRYRRGVGDVLSLLDAERTLAEAQTRLAGVRQAALNARLALHRALGGSWTEAPAPDDPRLFE
ncbi:efflux transporter outer membrane subunit [Salinibacter altiplanensis]|uniref:efflux transporter outer membrane subunit n=1 Tax=Salinibacter altiplanensis TaxID=1803181 RepID=UPI001F26497B|nr:efflux transporter outer membrane subunit [Salinibacter altiplanensis]